MNGIEEKCTEKLGFNAPEALAKRIDAAAGRWGRSRWLRAAVEEKLARDAERKIAA